MARPGRTPRDTAVHLARRTVAEARGRLDLATYRLGRSTAALRLPDFLGVGAQKAGTTWLHANLAAHPGIHVPPEKELHYFDWFRVPTLARYAESFASAGDRIAGEITPGYSALGPDRVSTIRRLCPDLRVLILLRDPVARAWSQVRMDLVRRYDVPLEEITASMVERHLAGRGASRRGDYATFVDTWRDAFGDAVWVGAYDDISTRPEELLADVLRHLGADPDIDPAAFPLRDRLNPGGDDPPSPEIAAVLDAAVGHQRAAMARYLGR